MNRLDTEIRRAMGELANAAPPAREPDSFRREFLVPRDPGAGNRTAGSGASRWLLATAATVVVGLVGVALVVATSDDSPATITPGPITGVPVTAAPTDALTGDALLDELSGRRWIALERFDDPSPTARTPEFTVTSESGGASVQGFDGCNTYGGTFQLDDATVEGGEIASTTIGCDVETLGFGGTIELLPDAATLLLSDLDGSPLARFHDLAQLPPASADDMPYAFFGDDLSGVGFGFLGDGRAGCTRIGWEESTDGMRIELLEILDGCSSDDGPLGGWLAAVAEPGAEAFLTPDGILIANPSGTLQLRRLAVVEPDPDGITLAAGAIFGIEPGLGTGPDDVLDVVVPRLGQPDADSGWLPAERSVADDGTVTTFVPCPELTEYREPRWGDLSFGFWATGSRTFLQHWAVGDRRIAPFLAPETNLPTNAPPTELETEDGVGVGDPLAAIPDRFDTARRNFYGGTQFDPISEVGSVHVVSANPAFTTGSVASTTRGGRYLVIDGTVAAFGAESFSC